MLSRRSDAPEHSWPVVRDVPWNAAFYARAGFRALETRDLWPALAERVKEEADRGLGSDVRVAMRFVGGVVEQADAADEARKSCR
jgi:hypothetical protein